MKFQKKELLTSRSEILPKLEYDVAVSIVVSPLRRRRARSSHGAVVSYWLKNPENILRINLQQKPGGRRILTQKTLTLDSPLETLASPRRTFEEKTLAYNLRARRAQTGFRSSALLGLPPVLAAAVGSIAAHLLSRAHRVSFAPPVHQRSFIK